MILATHAISFLKYANKIIVMSQGNVSIIGKLQNLIDAKVNLCNFIIHKKEKENIGEHEEEKYDDDQKLDGKQKQSEKTNKNDGKLMDDEERRNGRVSKSIYKLFAAKAYGKCLFISMVVSVGMYMVFENLLPVQWLAVWGNASNHNDTKHGPLWYLGIYTIIRMSGMAILCWMLVVEILSRVKAATYFHRILLEKVLKAPMSFFDTTPVGRVISRFSKDVNKIDDSLNDSFRETLRSAFSILTCIICVIIIIPSLLIAMLPLYILFYFIQKYFIATSRELERLTSVCFECTILYK